MKIQITSPRYLVLYFDQNDKEIGYSVTSKRWLQECKDRTHKCGTPIAYCTITDRLTNTTTTTTKVKQ